MLSITVLLAAASAGTCQIDRDLPERFASWRITPARLDYTRAIANSDSSGTSLDWAGLPDAAKNTRTIFFRVVTPGDYAVALDRNAPVALYGDTRDSAGTRIAIDPVGRRAGPVCTSIAAVELYRLQPGNYYARVSGIDDPIKALVKRLD